MSKIGKQREIILNHVLNYGEITKKKAVELTGHFYYCNESKHVGDVLSRMVKSGKLQRIRNGLFKIGSGIKNNAKNIDNQKSLFE